MENLIIMKYDEEGGACPVNPDESSDDSESQ